MKNTMELSGPRAAEAAKYVEAYRDPGYAMGQARLERAERALRTVATLLGGRGSLLDVGTGRGELLALAAGLGFDPVQGTEVVPQLVDGELVVYAAAHALPFYSGSWDVVTCCDVLEHLVSDDTQEALLELGRVASRALVVMVPSWSHVYRGVELHVNRRSEDEWDVLLRRYCPHQRCVRFPEDRELWILIR